MHDITDRREFLRALSLSPFALTGVGVFSSAMRAEAQAAGLVAPNVCIAMPETTEGPYYMEPELNRADITEGRAGAPLTLRLQVVAPDCTPLTAARVAVWHCDALGRYSGYPRQGGEDTSGETFLRGSQQVDGQGTAVFRTIYPGFYPGRTTHVHVKVFLGDRPALTSQVFFPDALSDYLYRYAEPYASRAETRDMTNRRDRIARAAGEGAFAQVREVPGGHEAAMVIGVDG